jgi:hypothetical protein
VRSTKNFFSCFFFLRAGASGKFFYIISKAKRGVEPQGFRFRIIWNKTPAPSRGVQLYYKQSKAWGRTSGISTRPAWRPGRSIILIDLMGLGSNLRDFDGTNSVCSLVTNPEETEQNKDNDCLGPTSPKQPKNSCK